MVNELLFLHRNTLSDISPSQLQKNPDDVLQTLLNGFIRIIDKSLLFRYSLTVRGFYGTNLNPRQSGQYSYNTLIALPASLRNELSTITLFQNVNGSRTPLNEVNGLLVWRGIELQSESTRQLLPYAAVYGGMTHEQNPLQQIVLGEEIAEILS